MVKADIKEAYRTVPIHPQDEPLCFMCDDSVYTGKSLPFGLHSIPKIFSAIADAIQWVLNQKGIRNIIHYLDYYILVTKENDKADYQKSQLVASSSELRTFQIVRFISVFIISGNSSGYSNLATTLTSAENSETLQKAPVMHASIQGH